MKRTIHTTQEQIRTENSDTLISVVRNSLMETCKKSDENTNRIIEAIKSDTKQEEILGFTGVVNAINRNNEALHEVKEIAKQDKLIQKIEEVKSALMASNIILKKLDKKEMPEQKEADFSKTNKLLSDLIEEVKKPDNVKITLKLV